MFGANKELFNRAVEKLHNIIGRERARITVELRARRNTLRNPRSTNQDQDTSTANTSTGGTTPQGLSRRGRGGGRGGKRTRSRSSSRARQPAPQQPTPQNTQGFRGRRPLSRGTARGGMRRPGQQRMAQPPQAANQNRQNQMPDNNNNFMQAVVQGLQTMMNTLNMPQ